MNYNETIAAWQNLLETPSTEIDFLTLIPRAIEASENRLYRELDFLNTIETTTAPLTPNSRNVTLPAGVIILRSMNVISPSSQSSPDSGTRSPLTRVSNEFLDMFWPQAATTNPSVASVPQYYAMLSDTQCLVAPSPDLGYTAEFIGTFRPPPLSPTNQTNYLSTMLPDLYIASGMVFWAQYYQNATLAAAWEQRYKDLFAGVNMEALRQKAASVSWTAYQPTPPANAPRSGA